MLAAGVDTSCNSHCKPYLLGLVIRELGFMLVGFEFRVFGDKGLEKVWGAGLHA